MGRTASISTILKSSHSRTNLQIGSRRRRRASFEDLATLLLATTGTHNVPSRWLYVIIGGTCRAGKLQQSRRVMCTEAEVIYMYSSSFFLLESHNFDCSIDLVYVLDR